MIRINLSPEPQWLDLGHGVRLQLMPLTTALMVATRSDPAVQALDGDASNDTRAAVFAAALARRAIADWEGVGDADGGVIAVSEGGIDALLSLWPIFEGFTCTMSAPARCWMRKKTALRPCRRALQRGRPLLPGLRGLRGPRRLRGARMHVRRLPRETEPAPNP